MIGAPQVARQQLRDRGVLKEFLLEHPLLVVPAPFDNWGQFSCDFRMLLRNSLEPFIDIFHQKFARALLRESFKCSRLDVEVFRGL